MAVFVASNEGPFHVTCGKGSGSSGSLKKVHLSVTVSFSLCSSAVIVADVKVIGPDQRQKATCSLRVKSRCWSM